MTEETKMDFLSWIKNGGEFKEYVMELSPQTYEDPEAKEIAVLVSLGNFKRHLKKINYQFKEEPVIKWLQNPMYKTMMFCKITAKVVPNE